MKQPYIGNIKINKLYKGSELWCNWIKSEPDVPTTFDTIIFCQLYNNININGNWSESSYPCFSSNVSNNIKSLYTSEKTSSITSNLLLLPSGVYRWSMYCSNPNTCKSVFIIEGDISKRYEITSSSLKSPAFNKIGDFEITSTSNITLKLSAENAINGNYCRFFDWKLEKIS